MTRVMASCLIFLTLATAGLWSDPWRRATEQVQNFCREKIGGPEDATLINQVHGHWVIAVRKPDGSLTARSELENAAVTPSVLPPILGRAVTQAAWSIELTATTVQPCPSEIIPGLHSH